MKSEQQYPNRCIDLSNLFDPDETVRVLVEDVGFDDYGKPKITVQQNCEIESSVWTGSTYNFLNRPLNND